MAGRRNSASVDHAEVERFAAIAAQWWDEDGAFKPLHRLNPARLAFVRDRLAGHFGRDAKMRRPFAGLRLLDIGCGGGLMCEPLARLGFAVTGLDADESALDVARRHAKEQRLAIDYRADSAEELAAKDHGFDAVLALEVVEHTLNPTQFMATAGQLVTPGGALVASTLNRTPKAYLFAILGAEYFLRWLPRGTHEFKKFRRPSELAHDLRGAGLKLSDLAGLQYDPWREQWQLGKDLGVNYLLFATKPR
jgi:2-polyprenyl-6-hydroxyphenyl methylase/3-demethylubiquinone-9 3-methyltransferase